MTQRTAQEDDIKKLQETIDKTLAIVKRFSSPYLDQEQISIDIVFRSLEKGPDVLTAIAIRNKCRDAFRVENRRPHTNTEHMEEIASPPSQTEEVDEKLDSRELVNILMNCPSLSSAERNLLYYRFYKGFTFQGVGKAYGIDKSQAKRRVESALEKIREWILSVEGRETS